MVQSTSESVAEPVTIISKHFMLWFNCSRSGLAIRPKTISKHFMLWFNLKEGTYWETI